MKPRSAPTRNRHSGSRILFALLVGLGLLGATSDLQQGGGADRPGGVRLSVVAAGELVERSVRDERGIELGRVDSLLVAMETAKVRYVVVRVEEPDASPRKLVAIPWQAVHFERTDGSLRLTVDRVRFRGARRFGTERLTDLTRSAVIVEDDLYWNPGATTATEAIPPDPQSREPHLWVGHRIVRAILPPQFQLSRDLKGVEVRDARGETQGELETVVIALDSGHVAYALVARGGFVGLGREWLPVPLEVLRWKEERQSYEIPAQVTDAEVTKRFPSASLPITLAKRELVRLYRAYGLDPAWLGGNPQP